MRWTPAFSKSLMCHLRKDDDYREVLNQILLPHEVDSIMMATHRPNYALQVGGRCGFGLGARAAGLNPEGG